MSQKTTRDTRVLALRMSNLPAIHVESTCIRVLIECPKKTTRGTRVLLMLCAEITHAVKHAC